jgi:hypothetical protein
MTIQPEAIGGGSLAASRAALSGLNLALLALVLAPFFWAAWQIEPLYTENQNTKFLHGLADAGVGFLREDWMARTKDGLPAFTLLVEGLYRAAGPLGFYAACLASYIFFVYCALVIYRRVTGPHGVPAHGLAPFLALLFFLATISDLHEIFLGGFSKQYILSGYFQTSDFGVFLLAGVLLFERGSIPAAMACVVLAATMHAAYVVPGIVLTAIFALHEIRHPRLTERGGSLVKWASFALAFVALAAISVGLKLLFVPTDPQAHLEAHRVLTQVRIPHHADPWRWFNQNVILQFGACLLAVRFLPAGPLRFVIKLGTLAMAVFALVAFLPHTETYRLVAPWRLSVVIVPLASISLCAIAVIRLSQMGFLQPPMWKKVVIGSAAAILLCVTAGGAVSLAKWPTEKAYVAFARGNLASGQLYLTNAGLVDFRLAAGVPQYVTFRTHPYQDAEVLEWSRRLDIVNALFKGGSMDCERLRRLAADETVTHVLIRKSDPAVSCDFAEPVFDKDGDQIFRLQGAKPPQ